MLICNNCNTTNEQDAQKCVHCHMVGNFRPADQKPEVVKLATSMVICQNCASDTPGEGTKCVHCNFPFAPKKVQTTTDNQTNNFQNLKIG